MSVLKCRMCRQLLIFWERQTKSKMYNRTPRLGVPLKSQTPELIGPTTYIICEKKPLKNCVPFLSSEKRKPSFFGKPNNTAFYTLPSDTIRGGTSPRFTGQRYDSEPCATPGPADYDLLLDPSKSQPRPHGKGNLYLCKVRLSGKNSGPSIPTKMNENGYRLDDEGNLFRIPPDLHDTSLGPAFYEMSEDKSYCYNGCKWSRRTSQRNTYVIAKNPGPGDYDLLQPENFKKINNDRLKELAKKMSYLPRYFEELACKAQKENFPGPAAYYILKDTGCNKCESLYPRPFISRNKRFVEDFNENPAAWDYEIAEIKYPVSKHRIPFLKRAPRFPDARHTSSPGPADYLIKSPIQENICHHYNEVGSHMAPFGCSTKRLSDVVLKDSYYFPSPAEYAIEMKSSCKIPVSSVFKSKVKRFPVDCVPKMTQADLQYDPVKAFHCATAQKSHKALDISFNATTPLADLFDHANYKNPGPPDYHYEAESEYKRCKGFIIPTSKRFPDPDRCQPGPGYYNIHPSFTTSTYQAFETHNLSIKEKVLKKKLKKHPRETWKKWATTLKKDRQLRWFARGGVNYSHC